MIAMLCDSNGQTMLGSDTMTYVSGNKQKKLQQVKIHKDSFKKHFPHKYDFWTHVYFVQKVSDKITQLEKIPSD